MDYVQPLGGAANDPYVDADPGLGIEGSPIPAAALEHPQREIVEVITRAGLAPDGGDLTQLAAAIELLIGLAAPTGSVKEYIGVTAPAGWLLLQGGTIGNALSGASVRANADTEALFTLVWDSIADTEAPLFDSAGAPVARGASAAVDFGNDRRITLPDARGRSIIGGGTGPDTAEGGGAGTARTHGAKGGVETHVQTLAELAAHTHNYSRSNLDDGPSGGSGSAGENLSTLATTGAGSSTAMDWMHPWLALNLIIKL